MEKIRRRLREDEGSPARFEDGCDGGNDKSEGEHWFHTEKQMEFPDDWIRKSIGGMRK